MKLKIFTFKSIGILGLFLFFQASPLHAQWNFKTPQTTDTLQVSVNKIVDANTVWMGGTELFWDTSFGGYFGSGEGNMFCYRTNDGGTNWTATKISEDPALMPYLNTLHPFDYNNAWVGYYSNATGENFIYRTRNGGTTWTRYATNTFITSGSYINNITFKDTMNGLMLGDPSTLDTSSADMTFEIQRTTDGGATWNRIPKNQIPDPMMDEYGGIGDFSRFGDTIKFCTTMGRIFKSNNGGLNWTVDTLGLNRYMGNFQFVDAQHGICYLADTNPNIPGKVMYTGDGGKNWQNGTHPLVNPDTYYWSHCLIPESYYIFATVSESPEGGPFRSWLSKDYGATWMQVDTGNGLSAARFYNPKVGFAGEGLYLNQNHGTRIYTYKGSPLTGLFSSHKLPSKISIYPNPSKDLINIEIKSQSSSEILILINAMDGKLVMTKKLESNTNIQIETIDIGSLSKGIYTITFCNAEGNSSQKFIKN